MKNNTKIKIITFFLITYFHPLMSMKYIIRSFKNIKTIFYTPSIRIEPIPSKEDSPFYQENTPLIHSSSQKKHEILHEYLPQEICTIQEIHNEILSYVIPQQWWYLDQIYPGNGSFFVPFCCDLSGKLYVKYSDNKAVIYDTIQKKAIVFDHNYLVNDSCIDLSGKFLATASGRKARIFDIEQQKEIISFVHDEDMMQVALLSSETPLKTISYDGNIRTFMKYNNYTLEQIILKNMIYAWMLTEKPCKEVDSIERLLLALSFIDTRWSYKQFLEIWKTFSPNMQRAIWNTTSYKIQKYGKNSSFYIMQ